MRKQFLIVMLALTANFLSIAQSSFPVAVQNFSDEKFKNVPDDLFNPTTKNLSIGGKLETPVATINAATYPGTSVLLLQGRPGRRTIVRAVMLTSNIPVLLAITGLNGTGYKMVWVGPGYFNGRLELNTFLDNTGGATNVGIYAYRSIGRTLNANVYSDTAIIGAELDAYTRPADMNFSAWGIRVIGDSHIDGYTVSTTADMYVRKTIDYMRSQGKCVRLDNIGYSGTGTTFWTSMFNNGFVEAGLDKTAAVFICLGTNDANGGAGTELKSVAQYKADMKNLALRVLNGENKKIHVVLIGALPQANATTEALAVQQRAILPDVVNELNTFLGGTRCHAVNVGSAYAGTNTTYSGDGIHSTNSGASLIFSSPIMAWFNSSDGQGFLAAMPTTKP